MVNNRRHAGVTLFELLRTRSTGRASGTQGRHNGVTLLELLLALALTGLILIVIGMAIELNLRTLDTRRGDVERVQLAAAVLRHIAADLQNAVIYEPIDMGGAADAAAAMDPMAMLGGMGMGGDPLEDLLGGSDLLLGDTISENTLDIAGTVEPTSVPGLYGNQYEIQVDASRLPRVDQYQQVMLAGAGSTMFDIPSDVKTVAYYLATGSDDTGAMSDAAGIAISGGLVRRQMDRAVTSWASMEGGLDTESDYGQVLAPEVNYLEFRYFDGLGWVTEWDSDQLGGLPVAVEVTIGIDPAYGMDAATTDFAAVRELSMADMSEFTYRLVVRLPTAKPIALEEFLQSEEMEATGL